MFTDQNCSVKVSPGRYFSSKPLDRTPSAFTADAGTYCPSDAGGAGGGGGSGEPGCVWAMAPPRARRHPTATTCTYRMSSDPMREP